MVLRNWYNVMKAHMAKGTISQGFTGLNGTKRDAFYRDSVYQMLGTFTLRPLDGFKLTTASGSNPMSYYMVGSGTTPATFDDYKLENTITSGLTCTTAVIMDANNDAIHKFTFTNISNNDITIGEIGIIGSAYYSGSNHTSVLVERTVLDSPLTIPAGGIGTIDYSIKIPIPTA